MTLIICVNTEAVSILIFEIVISDRMFECVCNELLSRVIIFIRETVLTHET